MTKTHRTLPRLLGAALAASLMLLATAAHATGFQYMVKNQKSQMDGDKPALVLQAADIVKGGTVIIKSSSAPNQKVKLGSMRPGNKKIIKLKAGKGTHQYEVLVKARGVGGQEVEIPFEFAVTRVPAIKLSVDREGVDTGEGVIPFTVNRPLERVDLEFFNPDGKTIGSHSQEYGGRYGKLEARWKPGGEIGGISLKAYDVDGFWTSVLLEPWWIEIEHEEIIFDFGKATWQASEEPKLEKSLAEIREAMKRHAKHRPDMRLYVAGYTDTVGSAAQNRKLSEERARAISRWFKRNGVDMPVYYQGFGESVLAVKTPDETAEARNRRALYVLGNAPPPRSASLPRANWRRVK